MARASKYAAATMTVTVREDITINSKDYGSVQSFTMASIANVDRRIVTASTTEATILTFSSIMSAGQHIAANVKYLRFTNLDDTNFVILTFANQNDDEAAIKLDAGNTFIFAGDNSGGMADVLDAIDGTGLTYSLGDLKSVTIDADTASCDVEIFVAEIA